MNLQIWNCKYGVWNIKQKGGENRENNYNSFAFKIAVE